MRADNNSGRIEIMIGDSDRLRRQLLTSALRRTDTFSVIACERISDIRDLLLNRPPNLALLVGAPVFFELLDAIDKLKSSATVTRIVLMLEYPEPQTVIAAFQHGLRGVLPLKRTSFATIRKCIRRVLEGQFWISTEYLTYVMQAFGETPRIHTVLQMPSLRLGSREAEVMGLASRGLSNKRIANTMQISEHTVKKHMRSLFRKAGVQGRVELATYVADRQR